MELLSKEGARDWLRASLRNVGVMTFRETIQIKQNSLFILLSRWDRGQDDARILLLHAKQTAIGCF